MTQQYWRRRFCTLPSAPPLVNSVSGVCSPSILSLTSNGCTADTARYKAEYLNSVFASKFCVPNQSLSVPTLSSHTQLFLDSVSFSPDKVESLLSNLDSDSATSPDSISPHVLKTCSAALAHPLSVLFTLSFAQGHPPSAWKSANLTALHKKCAKTDPCNYRPISLLPIISKVMESIIASDIKSFLFSNGLISDHQFGFRRVTPPWICCFCSPNNGWTSSMPDMKSERYP